MMKMMNNAEVFSPIGRFDLLLDTQRAGVGRGSAGKSGIFARINFGEIFRSRRWRKFRILPEKNFFDLVYCIEE